MEAPDPRTLALLAEALRYPAPGRLAALQAGLEALPPSPEVGSIAVFLKKVGRLSLGEWEELHTRTLDLDPPSAPYVGFQMWGESYQRGAFLSQLNRALFEAGVDAAGELPDHLIPVLRYLAAAPEPLPELAEALGPAVGRMLAALRKVEPGNPYLDLLEAVKAACKGLKAEAV